MIRLVKRKGFPEIGEDVVVSVIRITPYSALCKLEEYSDKEGMIHVSQVSGKWVRDIKKFVKMNKQYVAKVMRIDEEKGHIALSLKRVPKKAKERKIQEFKNEQRAEKILEIIAKKKKISLDKAYEKIGYDLQEKFGDMYEAFSQAFKSPDPLIRRGVDKQLAELIHKIAKENIQKKTIKTKAELTLKFYTGDGIERIKKHLSELKDKYNLDVKYISAPKYIVEVKSDNPKLAEKELTSQLTDFTSGIKDGEASFKIVGEK